MTEGGFMHRSLIFFTVLLLSLCVLPVASGERIIVEPIPGLPEDFIRGADISTLAWIEECGGKYYDRDGREQDLFTILKDSGVNWIRLRLWHNPVNPSNVVVDRKVLSKRGDPIGGGNNNLKRTVSMAKRAKDAGSKLLLDIHYSDFWADPENQRKPLAWARLSGKELEKAVYEYTLETLRTMKKEGCFPDMVQIGNELNGGMLWPDGKTWTDGTEEIGGFEGFTNLLKQGVRAVRRAQPWGAKTKVMIHLANGGDNGLYRWVFDEITAAKVDYDVIGLSFYPYWHGSMDALTANLRDLVSRYGKEVCVVETAYGFTEEDGDAQGNRFQIYSDEKYGYLPTVQGQATEVRDVMAAVHEGGGEKGLGVFYWEPAWILVEGAGWRTGEGNNWENQAMFDYDGRALPSLEVFKRVYDRQKPEIKPVSFETPKALVVVGSEPVLPSGVKIIYSDDSLEATPVEWDDHDFSKETKERTFMLDGRTAGGFPVKMEVTMSRKVNLVDDPSWESGKLGQWKLDGNGKYCFVENNKSNAYSGTWTYKYWWSDPFKSTLSRTFTGIPDGTYTLSLYAMGGGGENTIELFAENYGGPRVFTEVVNTGWKNWKQYTVSGIEVRGGKCTIGIHIDANGGNWGNFDDVEFYLEPN